MFRVDNTISLLPKWIMNEKRPMNSYTIRIASLLNILYAEENENYCDRFIDTERKSNIPIESALLCIDVDFAHIRLNFYAGPPSTLIAMEDYFFSKWIFVEC